MGIFDEFSEDYEDFEFTEFGGEEGMEVRFQCDACGHDFNLNVTEDMPMPKYCLFCATPIILKD